MNAKTQRRLILVRHAKAVEDDPAGDHARALSTRGRADAEALGAWMEAQQIRPEQVWCSSAQRTRETLSHLGKNLPTLLRDKMYLATTTELLAQLNAADDAVTSLMLVGHNPGMHGLLAQLVGAYDHATDVDRVIMKFPTAACAVLRLEAASWSEVKPQGAALETLRWSADD